MRAQGRAGNEETKAVVAMVGIAFVIAIVQWES